MTACEILILFSCFPPHHTPHFSHLLRSRAQSLEYELSSFRSSLQQADSEKRALEATWQQRLLEEGSRWQQRLSDADSAAQSVSLSTAQQLHSLQAEVEQLRLAASLPPTPPPPTAPAAPAPVDFESEEVQAYVTQQVNLAVAAADQALQHEIDRLRSELDASNAAQERLQATVSELQSGRGSADSALQIAQTRIEELETENSTLQQKITTAGDGSSGSGSSDDGTVSPDLMKAIMQDVYTKSLEVFVPEGEEVPSFNGNDVVKRVRAVLKAVTNARTKS